jgi:hypothetical protein
LYLGNTFQITVHAILTLSFNSTDSGSGKFKNYKLSDLILIFGVLTPLSTIFQLFMATSFSGGGSRSARREPPIMGKQLVNFITCGCESSAPFL